MKNLKKTRTNHLKTLLTAAILALFLPAGLLGQDPSPEEIAKWRELYAKLAQPGPEHKMLEKMAGRWDQEIRMWPQPGAESMVMKGSIESKLVLGGRFLQAHSFMNGSKDVVAISFLGFDRRNGTYTTIGMDTMGTYWVTGAGPPGAPGEPIVMPGSDHDSSLGATQIYDFVVRWINDDTYVWEIIFKDKVHTRGTGEPFKMVEITARRRQ